MNLAIWKIPSVVGVEFDYVVADAEDRLASEPLTEEDIWNLIDGEQDLSDFVVSAELALNYSDDQWAKAEVLEQEGWEDIIDNLEE